MFLNVHHAKLLGEQTGKEWSGQNNMMAHFDTNVAEN